MDYTLCSITPRDRDANRQMDALLASESLLRDRHLDYSCGLFTEDGELVATASCYGPTLRCFAVAAAHRGEGLLNQLLTHLIEWQLDRGNTHLFVYTKQESARFFLDLGFYEIACVKGTLSFLENRRDGFASYCARLQQPPSKGRAAAIVMNANPFTLGHQHLIERAAAENTWVHLFVLSEEAGPIPASVRHALVQRGIAAFPNVILQEGGPYLISRATFPSYFFREEEAVIEGHSRLDLALFCRVAHALGVTRRYVGEEPDSMVTGLYHRVLQEGLPCEGIACEVIPRRVGPDGAVISASAVRRAIHAGELAQIEALVPASTWDYFQSDEAKTVIEAIRAQRDVTHY